MKYLALHITKGFKERISLISEYLNLNYMELLYWSIEQTTFIQQICTEF